MTSIRHLAAASILFIATTASAFAERTFVYTNNDMWGTNTVSAYRVRSDGTLMPVPGSPFATGGSGTGYGFYAANRTTLLTGRDLLFVANAGSNDISVFHIDPSTGVLTAVAGSPFAGGSDFGASVSLAATPDGRFLIAANADARTIAVFGIGATGALSPAAGSPYAVPDLPDGIKISPNGRYLAVAYPFTGAIDMFAISRAGQLQRITGSPFAAWSAAGVDINCTSDKLFAASANYSETIANAFSLDRSGRLAAVAGSPFEWQSGQNSNLALLSPTDDVLYISNQYSATVTVARVGHTGQLTLLPGSPFPIAGGKEPAGMATDRLGRFLFVADYPDQLAVMKTGANGSLATAPGSPYATGNGSGVLSLAAFPSKSCAVDVRVDVLGNERHALQQRHGKIRIAVMGAPAFDPSAVDIGNVAFDGAVPAKWALKDVNHDGYRDLVLWIDAADVRPISESACVFGTVTSGRPFAGCVSLEDGDESHEHGRSHERRN